MADDKAPCLSPLFFFFFFFLCDLEDFFDLEREDFFLFELLLLCKEDEDERADEDERRDAMDDEADVELDTDEIEERERERTIGDVDDECESHEDELGEDECETRLFLLFVERLECSVRCLDFFLLFLFDFFSLLCLDDFER